jgi:hypothetical protein
MLVACVAAKCFVKICSLPVIFLGLAQCVINFDLMIICFLCHFSFSNVGNSPAINVLTARHVLLGDLEKYVSK